MTPEELDEARVKEAWRIWNESEEDDTLTTSIIAARLAREGWTPPEPEPVDPDLMAFREWAAQDPGNPREAIEAGRWDSGPAAKCFLAGARMAREQERERAKVLVEYVREAGNSGLSKSGEYARAVLCKYARAGDD